MANQQQGRDQGGNASSNQGSHQADSRNNASGGQDGGQIGNRDKDTERNQGSSRSGDNKQRRGFAAMDQAKQREIASMGGHAAHRSGNAHEFDAEEAREAGRKGGQASARNRAASARNDDGHRTGNR